MVLLLWSLVIGLVVVLGLYRINKDYCVLALFTKRVKTVDGTPVEKIAPSPKGRTIFGNVFDMFQLDTVDFFAYSRRMAADLKKSYIQYGLGMVFYNIIDPVDAEMIMNNPNLITKGIVYNFMEPFLRKGLLISTDKKWHERRKMLTPAFHFNILGQFEEIFKEESRKFVMNLMASDQNESIICLDEVIPKFTLNSVCETALGVQLDNRLDGDVYRASFKQIEESITLRFANPFYLSDAIFNYFEGYKYKEHYKIVHEFSSGIIEKRRQLFNEEKDKENGQLSNEINEDDCGSKKKRYAMLDTLLYAEQDGVIDHSGICEEVDTFMFEGFDTTSMGLTFALMNLALHDDMQERCFQEIKDHIEDDHTYLDIAHLSKLKYLECFIKESLRLYPSVPTIMRKTTCETTLANKLILPAGTQISIHLFDILRNPKYFPNPNVFDPERFMPENNADRHPFAYVPFSAGQRNCIGQKFAMLEMKTLIIYILKNFKLSPIVTPKDLAIQTGLIIRTNKPIEVKFIKRIS